MGNKRKKDEITKKGKRKRDKCDEQGKREVRKNGK